MVLDVLPQAAMIDRILVVGAGQMGGGIAQVAATAGMQRRARRRRRCSSSSAGAGRDPQLAREAAREGRGRRSRGDLARISTSTELEAGRDCQLMIEAAPERFELKAEIFARADALLAPEAILASNTSSIPIGRLAATTHRPDRVCGMHFFNPVPVLQLVELIRGLDTSDETAADGARVRRGDGQDRRREPRRAGVPGEPDPAADAERGRLLPVRGRRRRRRRSTR